MLPSDGGELCLKHFFIARCAGFAKFNFSVHLEVFFYCSVAEKPQTDSLTLTDVSFELHQNPFQGKRKYWDSGWHCSSPDGPRNPQEF